ncbi:MAG: sulfatase [Verrucomicrobia bacterium]|jgi:arylsulfatase A-like enzyme|nr:sulfatase [Verrucomicrobiota bacterium]
MARKQPNILLFLADDLGWKDTGVYGSRYFETPNVDRLASEGMRFTNAYSANPLCSPTRASIMTGKNPDRLNITSPWCHFEPTEGYVPETAEPWEKMILPHPQTYLPTSEYTLPRALGDAGYRTVHLGKWHLGRRPYHPENHGYEVNIGGQSWGGPRSYFTPYQNDMLEDGPDGEYLTDRLGREAAGQMVASGDNRPFFISLWTYAVHSPYQGKEEYISKYEGKKDPQGIQDCPTMGAMVQSMDDAVGTVLAALEEQGLADNTIVIFMSDNGPSKGMVKGVPVSSAAPLRGLKGSVYEGGFRVPMIVRWPGTVAADSVNPSIVTSTDIYATILEMAGVECRKEQARDSISIVGLLDGSDAPTRDSFFCHYPMGAAYTEKEGVITPGSVHHISSTTVRRDNWKLIRRWDTNEYFPDPFELYDLAEDEGEATNLAAGQPELVRELDSMIDAYLADTGANCPVHNPDFDPATRENLDVPEQPDMLFSTEA